MPDTNDHQCFLANETHYGTECLPQSPVQSPRCNMFQLHAAPMRQWLTSALQRHHAANGVESTDPWPTAYERLTETQDYARANSFRRSNSSTEAAAAAAAAIACATLRGISGGPSCFPYKPANRQIFKSETFGSSLSGCSTSDISLSDSFSNLNRETSLERRPSHRITHDFISQFVAKYIKVISTGIGIVALCILLFYLRPILSQSQLSIGENSSILESLSLLDPPRLLMSIVPHSNSSETSLGLPDKMIFQRNNASSDHNLTDNLAHSTLANNNLAHNDLALSDDTQKSLLSRSEEHTFARWDLTLSLLLMIYILCSYALQRFPIICLHESVVSVVLGVLAGLFIVNKSATIRFGMSMDRRLKIILISFRLRSFQLLFTSSNYIWGRLYSQKTYVLPVSHFFLTSPVPTPDLPPGFLAMSRHLALF